MRKNTNFIKFELTKKEISQFEKWKKTLSIEEKSNGFSFNFVSYSDYQLRIAIRVIKRINFDKIVNVDELTEKTLIMIRDTSTDPRYQ